MPRRSLIACCVAAILLSACTASGSPSATPTGSTTGAVSTSATASPSTSPTVSPSPSWTAEQAAAIQAVDDYRAASQQIATMPSAFSEAQMKALLGKSAGPAVVKANIGAYLSLKKRGFRYDGSPSVLRTKATEVSDVGYGTEVVVTRCIDQQGVRVLDESGAEVSESELGYDIPDFNLRQYTVQKRNGEKAFRVYGLASAKGECGP